jgi:hypothetical protein
MTVTRILPFSASLRYGKGNGLQERRT